MMEGIFERKNGETIILEVQYLSEDLKKKIRDELVEICHGEYALVSNFDVHSFEATVKELINYRIPKYKKKRIGAIGELLLNVLMREFTDMRVVSPFFNLEERNARIASRNWK